MKGKDIPLMTQIISTRNGIRTRKVPVYQLLPASEVKDRQDKLGKNAGWYYGTQCEKCCGVWPAFMSETGFEARCYFVCLVCGKESEHRSMPWMATEAWNAGLFKWEPGKQRQMTIFDVIGG